MPKVHAVENPNRQVNGTANGGELGNGVEDGHF
jgi:hypothetical protein